jgi:hypothetical protein
MQCLISSYLIFLSRSVKNHMKKSLTWAIKTVSEFLNKFLDLSQFTNSELLEWKGSWVHLKINIATLPKIYNLHLSPRFPQNGFLTKETIDWGKGNDQNFQELLDAEVELILILGEQVCYCGPPVRVGTSTGNRWSFSLGPSHSGFSWSLIYFVISPVLECIIRWRYLMLSLCGK